MEQEKLFAMVQAAQRGEEQGITALYDSFHQDIYYYIYKIVQDQELALDLTQDTFVDILQKINTLQEPAAFVIWSRRVAYSRCTAHFRKRKELLADEDEDGYNIFDTVEEERTEFIPDAALDQEALKQAIHAMLDTLPEEQRAALMMRYFEEMSVSQIAQVQGVSEGTVKSRLNYGRKALGKAVEDYEKKNGIKLHCAGVVPLLLWLCAQGGKKTAATATVSTASAATTASSTAAAGTGLATKLVAGGIALTLAAGGITGALLLQPREDAKTPQTPPPKAHAMVWSGYGSVYTPIKDKYYEMTLTEFTEDTIAGHVDMIWDYEVQTVTDFTGTGTALEDGWIHYTLTCSPVTEPDQVDLKYNPETEQMVFDNLNYNTVTLDRWPLKEGEILSQKEEWSGIGRCDACWSDEHRFVIEMEEMTEISARGRITVYKEDGQLEHTGTFTARGYRAEDGSWMEAILDAPWDNAEYPDYPTKTFQLKYYPETGELWFYTMWFHGSLYR